MKTFLLVISLLISTNAFAQISMDDVPKDSVIDIDSVAYIVATASSLDMQMAVNKASFVARTKLASFFDLKSLPYSRDMRRRIIQKEKRYEATVLVSMPVPHKDTQN